LSVDVVLRHWGSHAGNGQEQVFAIQRNNPWYNINSLPEASAVEFKVNQSCLIFNNTPENLKLNISRQIFRFHPTPGAVRQIGRVIKFIRMGFANIFSPITPTGPVQRNLIHGLLTSIENQPNKDERFVYSCTLV